MADIAKKTRKINRIANELEEQYPGQHLTPDGQIAGSIVEVIAAEEYDPELFEASYPAHNARTKDDKPIRVKTTQGNRIATSDCPKQLIGLKIHCDSSLLEAYNGPGDVAWKLAGKRQKAEQCQDSLAKLHVAMADIPECGRLVRSIH